MTKNCLLAVVLLSLAFCVGCAVGAPKGGGGISVSVTPAGQTIVAITLTQQYTAAVTGTNNTAVTWSLSWSGGSCTGNPSPCGTIDDKGLYAAPATPPNPATVTVTATSQADSSKSDSATVKVAHVTVTVVPSAASVQVGLQQQFTATALPDTAPQTVSWAIVDCPTGPCGTIDANGLYTAPNSIPKPAYVSVQATSTLDASGIIKSKTTVVQSRMTGPYAFRFSGYDTNDKTVLIVGNFVANANGTIASGTEDEITANGLAQCTILGSSSYAIGGSDPGSANDHGTVTLKTSGTNCSAPHTYNFVLDANGDGQMIEFDLLGRGSGILQQADSSVFKDGALTGSFVFGFTGANIPSLNGKRAGMVGLFQADGTGGIGTTTAGQMDINVGGVAATSNNVTGAYSINSDGTGTMTLTDNVGGKTYQFDLYMVGGQTRPTNPLMLFAISTDPLTNPALAGTIVFQDPAPSYNLANFSSYSVSNLTGVDSSGSNTLVSLTAVKGDGNGNTAGSFDANNAGTIVAAQSFTCTYSASGGGRYIVTLLGNGTNCSAPALPFVVYASSASSNSLRGFLLDQSSSAVMTGTMDPQGNTFAAVGMAGPMVAATASSGTTGANQVAANLQFNFPGTGQGDLTVSGVRDVTDPGQHSDQITGTYTLSFDGTGTIKLTAPATENYVFYATDTSKGLNAVIQHFLMINVDASNKNSSVIYAER